jgi:hypothetical protein
MRVSLLFIALCIAAVEARRQLLYLLTVASEGGVERHEAKVTESSVVGQPCFNDAGNIDFFDYCKHGYMRERSDGKFECAATDGSFFEA